MAIFRFLRRRRNRILGTCRLVQLDLLDDLRSFLLDYCVFGIELCEEIVHEVGVCCWVCWRWGWGLRGENFLEFVAL